MEKVMKNRNVMLNSTGCGVAVALVRYLCIFLAVFAFASCSDLADSKNTAAENGGVVESVETNAKFCTVSGKISIGESSGATSSTLMAKYASDVERVETANDASSRSATSSLKEYTNTLNGALTVTASKDGSSEQITCDVTTEDDGTKTYSLKLTAPGDWTLQAVQRANVDDGTGSIYILDGTATVTVDEDYSPVTQDIVMSPNCFPDSMTGGISLSITDGTTESKIKSVTYYCEKLLNSTNNANSLSDNGTVEFESNKATINLEKVKPNCYEVTFNFNDANGNTLYSCREAVTVYGGFVTDTWFGEGSHLVKSDEGTIEFKITDDLLAKHGKPVETVPTTQMVLYEPYSEEVEGSTVSGYKYYLVDSADAALGTEIAKSTMDLNSFIFDNDGNFYAVKSYGDTGGTQMSYIFSNKSGFGTDGVMSVGACSFKVLSADRVTGDLYGIKPNEDKKTYWNSFTSASKYYSTSEELDFGSLTNSLYAINDDVLYVFGENSQNYNLYTLNFKGKSSGYDFTDVDETFEMNLTDLNLPSSIVFTDMIYQEENIYILAYDPSYYFGTVIKCNLFSGKFTSLQLPENIGMMTGNARVYATQNEKLKAVYSDEACTTPLTVDYTKASLFGTIIAPDSSQLSSYLCGPKKFIAIKPKKLVIADDGIAFYTDNGDLSFKNVNRVVYIDLESFAIDSENITSTTATFDAEDTDKRSNELTGCDWANSFNNLGLPSTVYAKAEGSDTIATYSSETYPGSTYFSLVIPCSDKE